MIYTIVIVLTVIVSVLLVLIVLIQKSKGGGLSSQFGGASSVMGVRQTNNFLEKGTWWLAGLVLVLSIVSAYTMPQFGGTKTRSQETPVQSALPGQFGDVAAPAADAPAAGDAAPAATGDAAPQGE